MSEPSAFDRADIEQALRQLNGQSNGMTVEQFAASRRKSASAPVAVSKTDYGPAPKAPEHALTASGTAEKGGSQRVPAKIVSGSTLWRWRTVTIGCYESPRGYRIRMALHGVFIPSHDFVADEMLGKMTVAESPHPVTLIRCSVGSLGFTNGNTLYGEICKRGKELGLELCPAEVGPLLCLDGPRGTRDALLHIAMEPLLCKNGRTYSFMISVHDSFWWLRSSTCSSHVYQQNDTFVFCLPSP